jgi:hypothetical protein
VNLPEGVTTEMLEALRRGERVTLEDGRVLVLARPYAPLSGELGSWSVHAIELESNNPPIVDLRPDYGAPSPLWPQSDEIDALVPEALLVRLMRWQHDFDANFARGRWTSEEAKRRWAEESELLVEDTRFALEGKAFLNVDLWPLRNP